GHEALNWPIEKKAAFRPVWKYRDLRAKINLQEAAKTLVEIRIGDYVADRPEQAILETYIYQRLLAKAWQLAKDGVLWKLDIPPRFEGTHDVEDWARLRLHPASSREERLQALDITDPNVADFILKRQFQVTNGK